VRFKNESFIYHASLTLQWTPMLMVMELISIDRDDTASTVIRQHLTVDSGTTSNSQSGL